MHFYMLLSFFATVVRIISFYMTFNTLTIIDPIISVSQTSYTIFYILKFSLRIFCTIFYYVTVDSITTINFDIPKTISTTEKSLKSVRRFFSYGHRGTQAENLSMEKNQTQVHFYGSIAKRHLRIFIDSATGRRNNE